MSEIITGIVVALLTIIIQEIRSRRKPRTTSPPPPSVEDCKRCFFFKTVKKTMNGRRDSDTKIIKKHRW